MASKSNATIVKLRSTESKYCYYTRKNKKNQTARMELKKYDPRVQRHVIFREER